MIPEDYYFMIDDGNGVNAAHVGIPARKNAVYIFESREDVREFIKRIKHLTDIAFGN